MLVYGMTTLHEALAHLNGVELRHMGGAHKHRVAGVLELELDADLGVAHHQLGRIVLGLDVEEALQADRPAARSPLRQCTTDRQAGLSLLLCNSPVLRQRQLHVRRSMSASRACQSDQCAT